jgi:hypothetical protein
MDGVVVTLLTPFLREHVFFVGSEERKSASDLAEKRRKQGSSLTIETRTG